ncbi:MAG TPA: DNA-binding transcriptional regulator [Kiritimatiellia bacterium]|nr:DNA-binding transcriptional regulator [Kiritimatiellia bacterium]
MTKRKPKARADRRVALAFPNTMVIAGSLLHGILDYAHSRGGWRFTQMPEQISPSAAWLQNWSGDGAFAVLITAEEIRLARRLPFPVVNLVGYLYDETLPAVTLDQRATGRLQARHLLERHFRRLAYYGTRDLWYSRERRAGFCEAASAAGVTPVCRMVPSGIRSRYTLTDQQAELVQWLRPMRPPFGVAASTDRRACMVMEACAVLGLRIPEDVAVIGVDNDPTVAPFSDPPLSSVARNDSELGRRAAELLDILMDGREPAGRRVLIPPGNVVARRSTETLAVEEPVLTGLVGEIREHLAEPFGVEFIVGRTRMSRRQVERLFRRGLGCPPYALINRLRVERACRLLETERGLPLTRVAEACGFTSLRHFRIVFQRTTGHSPAVHRKAAAEIWGRSSQSGSQESNDHRSHLS